MILTKLIEAQPRIPNMRLYVSTRQPHLLRAFQQDFGVTVDFNNERLIAECDLVFLCVLPCQAQQALKEVRAVAVQRAFAFTDRKAHKHHRPPPLIVSCLAATPLPKLKQLLCDQSAFLKTNIEVPRIKSDLFKSR
jgi:pyrroline-5-carboxylate reductase